MLHGATIAQRLLILQSLLQLTCTFTGATAAVVDFTTVVAENIVDPIGVNCPFVPRRQVVAARRAAADFEAFVGHM